MFVVLGVVAGFGGGFCSIVGEGAAASLLYLLGGSGVVLGILVEFFSFGKNLDAIREALESLALLSSPSAGGPAQVKPASDQDPSDPGPSAVPPGVQW